jgi:hypothetical protein
MIETVHISKEVIVQELEGEAVLPRPCRAESSSD